jgi:hypothetical protein
MITNATPEEWEEFNRVERESRAKQESIRGTKLPTREQLMAEVAILTELVRVLSDRVAELEKAMPEREPVLEEREACAKLLETTDLGGLKDNPAMQSWVADMLLAYVKAIRARGHV